MQSIRTKFLVLMLACVLLSATALVNMGIMNAGALAEEDSVQIMNALCAEQSQDIDMMLLSVEQAVNTMQRYTEEQMSVINDVEKDKLYMNLYVKKTKELAYNVVENCNEASTVYLCMEPEYTAATKGFWLMRTEEEEKFEEEKNFDVTEYAEDDERMEWYRTAVAQDAGSWCNPHVSIATGNEVITYVAPIHKGNMIIGAVAMDVNMSILKAHVESVQIYETGYAFLADREKNIYYHKKYPDGLKESEIYGSERNVMILLANGTEDNLYDYEWEKEEKKLTFDTLRNGMLLVLTARTKEIYAAQTRLMKQSVIFMIIIILVTILLTSQVTNRITRPLKELTQVAKKVADGDLNVSIECNTRDEVAVLAASFEQTIRNLKKHMEYINKLAYTDAMTGAMNKMAYKDAVTAIEQQMEKGTAEFAVVVMDINHLKKINDNFGHEFGDMLIRDSASIIQRTFKKNIIYRIGGDEFVTILENEDVKKEKEFFETFTDEIRRFNRNNTKYEQKVQIAFGMAVYSSQNDKNFTTVFRRADSAMYENKVKLKEAEKNETEKVKQSSESGM